MTQLPTPKQLATRPTTPSAKKSPNLSASTASFLNPETRTLSPPAGPIPQRQKYNDNSMNHVLLALRQRRPCARRSDAIVVAARPCDEQRRLHPPPRISL